jgi:hypothetical protein
MLGLDPKAGMPLKCHNFGLPFEPMARHGCIFALRGILSPQMKLAK